MYRIVRVAENYGLIIVVSPANATPQSETVEYYRYATWKIGEQEPDQFHRISKADALGYFSGHADGLGFDIAPDQVFASLNDVLTYCNWEKSKHPLERLVERFHELLTNAYLSSEAANVENDEGANERRHKAAASASVLVRYCQVYAHNLLCEFLPDAMAERAKLRPEDYAKLSPRQQWAIDYELGILDWDGNGD